MYMYVWVFLFFVACPVLSHPAFDILQLYVIYYAVLRSVMCRCVLNCAALKPVVEIFNLVKICATSVHLFVCRCMLELHVSARMTATAALVSSLELPCRHGVRMCDPWCVLFRVIVWNTTSQAVALLICPKLTLMCQWVCARVCMF